MTQYLFEKLDKDSLSKLYCDFGFRLKEIGALIGVSEDAILKRLKGYGLPTNPRGKQRLDVDVLYTGSKKDKKKELTDSELLRLCRIGYTDAAIGSMFNMTGEGIAYRRKIAGIPLSLKYNEKKELITRLKETPKDIIEYDYYNLIQEEFSDKYGISKIVWRPYIKELGISSKETNRIESYPPFTKEQRSLIIGSLLGDGSVSQGKRFYESHSNKQHLYLLKKYSILEPYSSEMHPCDDNTGMRFSTIHHPNFLEFYEAFYERGLSGKLIPVEFIKENWSDEILAYWFFDDGYYDDEKNELFISNLCPKIEQLEAFLDFLNNRFGWSFRYSFFGNIYNITFKKDFYGKFVDILLRVITPDLYYKIPEKYLTQEMVSTLSFMEVTSIKPKFYRLSSEEKKQKIEILLFNHFRKNGFPKSEITDKRLDYLLRSFQETSLKVVGGVMSNNPVGVKLCEHFFPNIYDCYQKGHRSPIEQWANDKDLCRLIKNRLLYADRITNSTMRVGVKLLFNAVTNFKPLIAKYLYEQYALNGKIFDYSCGFGSRMLAAMSLDMEYFGCEPNLKTYGNLNKLGSFLKGKTKGTFFITEKGSEETLFKENYFGFAFSSPPFFDYEIYSQDQGQSIIKYPHYEDWLIKFWKRTIENCKRGLIDGGYFGVCISINQHEHMIESTRKFCAELGLSLVAEYRAPYKQLFHENKDKYDLIMIFKKAK